jgi:sigma-54 specific flagellar transcriptional regulator A
VALLVKFYAERFAHKNTPISLTPDFIAALKAYDWPGNVRELSNLVHRFSTLFAGQYLTLASIPVSMLPKGLQKLQLERAGEEPAPPSADVLQMFALDEPGTVPESIAKSDEPNHVEDIIMLAQGGPVLPPEGMSLKEKMAQIERAFIEQALDRSAGNVSKTARLLNLQRTTLIEKIDKYRLRSA